MDKLPSREGAPAPVFGTTTRLVKEADGGFTLTLYLNLQNRTVATVTVWAREPQMGMAALEGAAQQLAQSVSPIIKPELQ